MGIAFPIGLRLWADGGRRTAERVGLFYSLNTTGAIIGSLAGVAAGRANRDIATALAPISTFRPAATRNVRWMPSVGIR